MMIKKWLSKKFNIKSITERLVSKEREFAQQNRDHDSSDRYGDDISRNLWQLRKVIEGDKTIVQAFNKGLNLHDALSYLRKSEALTRKECWILGGLALSKWSLKTHKHKPA